MHSCRCETSKINNPIIRRVIFSADVIPLGRSMPIYDNILTSVRSIHRLNAIQGIKILLSAWDEPLYGEDAYQAMDLVLGYLQRFHTAVIKLVRAKTSQHEMELCRRTIAELGLPEMMANPLTSRSFQSCLKILDRRDILNL
ncbi:MAG: Beta-lactamase domain protein [Methanothrix harundinacea]|jgi:hypothetical protein|uniref:Beta-lactamase domain protein n=1 Tax=Methanothrix harundinacea TaxID=301375 RepID=A0A117LEW5_9EURY|nr:MAG: Beta-lactamase domain protein [Methanothrix harundinacea]